MSITVDLSKYNKEKESENYIVYLEKKPYQEKFRQMVVLYKKTGRAIQCNVTDSFFKLLFDPEKFKAKYMKEQKIR